MAASPAAGVRRFTGAADGAELSEVLPAGGEATVLPCGRGGSSVLETSGPCVGAATAACTAWGCVPLHRRGRGCWRGPLHLRGRGVLACPAPPSLLGPLAGPWRALSPLAGVWVSLEARGPCRASQRPCGLSSDISYISSSPRAPLLFSTGFPPVFHRFSTGFPHGSPRAPPGLPSGSLPAPLGLPKEKKQKKRKA